MHRRPGFWLVAPDIYPLVYGRLLDRVGLEPLRAALAHADGYAALGPASRGWGGLPGMSAGAARLRQDAFCGVEADALADVI